jgi:hypothetical protein
MLGCSGLLFELISGGVRPFACASHIILQLILVR